MRPNMDLQFLGSVRHNHSEQGSSLIPVLFILLLITVLGLMAMRQGLVNLNISTNQQVKQLLVQSADAPLNQYSNLDISDAHPENTNLTTVIGNALDVSGGGVGKEYVFCFRSSSTSFGLLYNANTIQANTAATAGSNTSNVIDSGGSGFCDPTSDFSSGRKAVVTQVAVLQPTDTAGGSGSGSAAGTYFTSGNSIGGGGDAGAQALGLKQRVRVVSTSFIPAMATGVISTSNASTNCLQGRISDNSDPANAALETVTDCLVRNGVPTNTQVQDFYKTQNPVQTQAIN